MQQQKMPRLLDQGLVHKTRQENVHIYNLRRALCRKIKASVFENEMPLSLTESEYNYVSGFYKKKNDSPVYMLRQYSDDITPTEVAKLSKPEWDYFNTCYVFDPDTQKYVPKPDITEPEEEWCAQNILKRNNLIGDDDKKQLADILEKVNALEKQNAFIANLYANPRHPYFFEHKLDHVPGLLLLEASRQVGVAGFHLYGKVPTKGMGMMLTELAANFHNYVELYLPVNFVVQPHEVKLHKKGYWLAAKMDALIFQKGLKVAEVRVAGSCINQKTLNRIRARKVYHGE
jgi:hypothetical protein